MVSKGNLSLNDTFARCILFSSKLYIIFLRVPMFDDIEMIIIREICFFCTKQCHIKCRASCRSNLIEVVFGSLHNQAQKCLSHSMLDADNTKFVYLHYFHIMR